MYDIQKSYLPIRDNVRPGKRLTTKNPVFFVAHDIGLGGSTARQNYLYFSRQTDRSASAHVFIDDQEILEMIPTGLQTEPAEKAWHVIYNVKTDNARFGVDANDAAIGVELCWGPRINFKEAYARYVWYFSQLCARFHKDSKTDIVGHFQLDPTRKKDPLQAFQANGITWERFISDVSQGGDQMELTEGQWNMLIEALQAQSKKGKIQAEPWVQKAKEKKLTVSELTWLNMIVSTR